MQVEEDEQMCEILNKYFSSVFTLERPEGLMELENRLNQEKVSSNLNKVIITEEIVYKNLCSLKSSKAHGDDGRLLHGRLLLKVKAMGIGSLVQIGLNHGLVIGNKDLLLIVNVHVDQKLIVECPRARSWGLYYL